VESVRLGPVTVRSVPVMTAGFARPVIGTGLLSRFLPGVFPPQLATAAGFSIHGLVSHGFLRRYRWTIDFTRMTMRFAPPG
jgi:hypothetical protein